MTRSSVLGHLAPWPFHSDGPEAIIGHRDPAPWNIVARHGLPVAFIDRSTAGPTDRLDEAAWAFFPASPRIARRWA